MHIFFSGIGGVAIGPLALIAKEAGYEVSGSDKQDSQYIEYLRGKGIKNISIGQNTESITSVHKRKAIDWYVYSSAVAIENPDSAEFRFCRENNIKISKRDELLNLILAEKKLKLIAIAGTHGKTTTTSMVIWLLSQVGIPLSYSVGAKISFGDMGQYLPSSEYFVYEADEFDRNFLAFEPYLSLISGVSWDHHEIYPTREDYQQAFMEFIRQSQQTIIWKEDKDYLGLADDESLLPQDTSDAQIHQISLKGLYNRLDGWLAIQAAHKLTGVNIDRLIGILNRFPGLERRMEQVAPNIYTDDAHTPDKIRGVMSVALEMAAENNQRVVVVYEPLTNRRQHFMIKDYKNCFEGASKVYWLPSYLAREDPTQRIISPTELISYLTDPSIAEPRNRDSDLVKLIKKHVEQNDIVVGMAGGGGNSLDEWLRKNFKDNS